MNVSEPVLAHADVAVVILAAGKGTRMGSDLAKVLHPLKGTPLIAHVLTTCSAVGVGQTVVVVGHQRAQVEAAIAAWRSDSVVQDQQLGTGHAVLCTQKTVTKPIVLVLCGDCPMVPAALLERTLARHVSTGAACTAVAARMADPAKYGRMITDANGRLTRIVEYKDANVDERAIALINSGIYAFNATDLFRCLHQVKPNNAQGEYYLTDVVGMLVGEGKRVECVVTDDSASVMGVNTPQDLAEAELIVGRR